MYLSVSELASRWVSEMGTLELRMKVTDIDKIRVISDKYFTWLLGEEVNRHGVHKIMPSAVTLRIVLPRRNISGLSLLGPWISVS